MASQAFSCPRKLKAELLSDDASLDGVGRMDADPESLCSRGVKRSRSLANGCDNAEHLDRISASELSARAFSSRYVETSTPCLITDAQTSWPAVRRWQIRRLLKLGCGRLQWRIGDRPDQLIRLQSYLGAFEDARGSGMLPQQCIFDSAMVDVLAGDYAAPSAVESSNLFRLVEGAPTHRWIIIGAAGSGTQLHVDPLATCAWNAVVCGAKQWALFPPTREDIKDTAEQEAEDDLKESMRLPANAWFSTFLPQTRGRDWRGPRALEVLQRAGDTIFVPEGWRHAVLNVETSVAVTHNVATPHAMGRMLAIASHAAPIFAARLSSYLNDTSDRSR
mmetsp:Transcript_6435/g.14033  ORF Transcript_6435/g.14033 Transcript_6435/m.14033 type:complete len:334 (-) Transcript_6435:199-1200(-)